MKLAPLILAALIVSPGCQTEISIFPATPKPATVYAPPPMFDYVVVMNPPDQSAIVDQWVKLWREMGYSETESLKRAFQMVAIR